MKSPHAGGVRLFAILALLVGCTSGQPQLAELSPERSEGSTTILQAAQEANAGRYGVADKILADYSARSPSTPEAADALYWRALYKLDPANSGASPHESIVLLDSYLGSAAVPRKSEALMLRRVAAGIEARTAAAAASALSPIVPTKSDAPRPEDKAKDDEIQRLKEELAKANAELERIKRRLAQPKP
ncbi:MAG: hypothetical protein ABJE10_06275 [bacterium]